MLSSFLQANAVSNVREYALVRWGGLRSGQPERLTHGGQTVLIHKVFISERIQAAQFVFIGNPVIGLTPGERHAWLKAGMPGVCGIHEP